MHLPSRIAKRSSDWVLQFINIVFLLLLFFLVNGTIAGQQELMIKPPRTILVTAANPPGDAVHIDVSGGIIYLGNRKTVEELGPLLTGAHGVKVVADRRLQALRLVDILGQFRRLGLGNISLITVRDDAP